MNAFIFARRKGLPADRPVFIGLHMASNLTGDMNGFTRPLTARRQAP